MCVIWHFFLTSEETAEGSTTIPVIFNQLLPHPTPLQYELAPSAEKQGLCGELDLLFSSLVPLQPYIRQQDLS